jgi:hypothetical protein
MELKHNDSQNEISELGLPPCTLSKTDIERLGRQRPEAFRTAFAEIGFCFSLLSSMFMAVSTPHSIPTLSNVTLRNTSSVDSD